MAVLAHVIDPAWTRGHDFTVEQRVGEAAWFIVARDAGGLGVTRTLPTAPRATVIARRRRLPAPAARRARAAGERPAVRGDRVAVAL